MCQCKGSSGAVHLECMRTYLHTKRTIYRSTERVTTLFWKKFECEICRQGLPLSIQVNDKAVSLVKIEEHLQEIQTPNYLILESLTHQGVGVTQRLIHIVKPQEIDEFSLGRGEGHDLLLNDITSSDIHAFLYFKEGTWTLEDNDSKYGTTVLMNSKMLIDMNYEKSIQVGRSIINLCMEPKEKQEEKKEIDDSLK